MDKRAVFSITPSGELRLDGAKVNNVKGYRLSSSARETAELALILDVRGGQVGLADSESES